MSRLFIAAVATTALLVVAGLAVPGGALLTNYHPVLTNYHAGNSGHDVSSSPRPDQLVKTTTSLGSSDPSPVVGEVVTFTATVAPEAPNTGTPTGNVSISGNSGMLCSGTLNQSSPDQASCTFSYPQSGSDSVIASYNGDNSYNGSTSGPLAETISAATTTTSIAANPTSSVVGQNVTYTATVAAVSPGSGTPTGQVEFTDSGGTICSGTLDQANSDQASCTTSYSSVGTDSVTANYQGDGNYLASSSDSVGETISQAQTSTDISASPTSPVVGQPVTYTATVLVTAPGSGIPTGSVSFVDTGGTLCTTSLDQSSPDQATCETTYTMSEDDSITATYEGDNNYAGSQSSTYSESVSPDATTTGLAVNHDSPVVGQNITYTATVADVAPGSGTPTGNVTFYGADNNTICVSALDQDATDQATCSVSYPSSGDESVTASYAGDTNSDSSVSSELTLTVSPDSTATAIKSSDPSPVVGEIVTFTATVSAQSPGSGTPTGSVTFTGDAGTLCTVTLDGQDPDEATCSTSYSETGSDSVQATYNGDLNYSGSQSPAKDESIGPAATSSAIATSSSSPVVGEKITFTGTVTVQSPGTGTPTGQVKFVGNSGQLCVGTLDDTSPDQASCTTSYTNSGSDSVTAMYEGATDYSDSTSSPVHESIGAAQTTVKLTGDPEPSVTGENVTFTAKVKVTAPGKGTPGGTVVFVIDTVSNTQLSCKAGNTVTLSGAEATCLVQGSNLIAYESPLKVSANYQGSSAFVASSVTVPQDVYAADTKLVITSSKNPTPPGRALTLTATVTVKSPGTGTPTGTVTFKFPSGDSLSCSGGDTVTLSSGVATCSIPDGIQSTVKVIANYSGTTPPAYVASKHSLVEQVT